MSSSKPVIIIGSGLAGLSAALEICTQSSETPVLILEKEARFGGNSDKASSGINGIFTKAQQELHIEDSIELFLQDTLKSGKEKCQLPLVQQLVEQSTSAISFLESFGVNLMEVCQCGGHTRPRTHRTKVQQENTPTTNIGHSIISTLLSVLKSKPNVTMKNQTQVLQLITDESGSVTGVKINSTNESSIIDASAVILTTGGYGQDRNHLLQEYVPQLKDFPSTNGTFASGDGIKLAKEIGAALVDMDQVQIHPTGLVNPNAPTEKTVFLAPEALRAVGGVLVNEKGERFVNELGTRDVVSQAILHHCKPKEFLLSNGTKAMAPPTASLILNTAAAVKFDMKILQFYMSKGFVKKAQGLKELAQMEHMSLEILQQTFQIYNEAALQQRPDPFGKTVFSESFENYLEDALFIFYITPSIHYTMGGVQFDTKARVINTKGQIIPHLFAAGEVTGGLHGANRLAGNSLLECVVYGRIAGRESLRL